VTTDQLPEQQGAATDGDAAVTVRNLRIETTRGVAVVPDASFEIAPGEVLGVVGESGSGKTTVGLALLGHARRARRLARGTEKLADHDI
jgi:peptide/nickel transport system ATP-binding protein